MICTRIVRLSYPRPVSGIRTRDEPREKPGARRDQMRQQVLADGYARLDDLSRSFGVSLMTVHRDIDALVSEGWLTKLRGGATANPSALLESSVRDRGRAMKHQKGAIAAVAAAHLRHGQTIFLDDSTTVMALLPHLAAHAPMTVATNFLPTVSALADAPGVDLIVLGGRYQRLQDGCYGLQTTDAIAQLNADLLFMSTTAVQQGACYHRSEPTLMVRRSMMAHSARTILLIDHAKFGRPAPHLLGRLSDFDLLVTDSEIDPDDLAEARQHITVEVAPG